jgi:hypothetical protein
MGAAKCPRFGFATWSAQVGALEGLFWGPHRGFCRGGVLKAVRPLSLEEYLALEREAPVKHELVEGFPHAMAGASDRHNRVVVNLVLALGPLAREKGRVEVRSRSGRSFTLA